jgi:hypothetical protein
VHANTERNKEKWAHLQSVCDDDGDQRVTLEEWEMGFVKLAATTALEGFIQSAGRSSQFLAEFVDKVHAQFNASICEAAPKLARDYEPPDTACGAQPPPFLPLLFNLKGL